MPCHLGSAVREERAAEPATRVTRIDEEGADPRGLGAGSSRGSSPRFA